MAASIPEPVRFRGAPGSPYTRKMLAYLRYRHIRYEFLLGDQASSRGLPEPKVALMPTFFLPDEQGTIQAVVDSTPLIRRFEAAFPQRACIPSDPALSFLNYLIEDYADEWLTKAMFHYRWRYPEDIAMAANILPRWSGVQEAEDILQKRSRFIADRQVARLYVVGSNDITAPIIEDSYRRFLALMDTLIARQRFVLGARPSSADFGIYAQLTQLAKFDPTPARICLETAPRVYAWTDIMDDLTGQPAEDHAWMSLDDVPGVLGGLLHEIGRVYVPFLLANAEALQSGRAEMRAEIDGQLWVQPSFPYQGRCLQWIRAEYQSLSAGAKSQVKDSLAGTGCERLLEPAS